MRTKMRLITTLMLFCTVFLSAVGMVMVYSLGDPGKAWLGAGKQFGAFALGCLCALGLAQVSARTLRRLAPWAFLGALILLILVLIPGIGREANSARRWFHVGVSFQPSDFAKLALVLFLAYYGERWWRTMSGFRVGLVVPGAAVALVAGLILLEPDFGTAILVTAVAGIVLLVAGTRATYLAACGLVALLAAGWYLHQNPDSERARRVYSWLHLEETKEGDGHQVWHSRVALGSGGLEGKGLDQSTQKRIIPYRETDFIFAIIGEEFGYVGAVAVITAFAALFACGLAVAWHAPDAFGMLTATGVSCVIGLQALINIAVVTGALPNKGIALPFVSQGGSNLLMMLAGVGLLLSIAGSALEQAGGVSDGRSATHMPFARLA